ncbi:hypothetical protein [Xanthomonas vesicatoria]|uniref:Uncharacterized protein n=1 Tax=Xanthomonas vesicatoria TaxID=56460 RepID=A0ABS8LGE5_9XANT|nr:hypothetical protein [Xanthomonas vesicatoria]APO93588.1 hypothetical protein BI313_02200 [Xanthomonas vesicatoria]MCC8624804.1 hypothetical protein [Xanthomonas vesicatoria]MCC8694866.1 hypothetical protein [Xanthomonas vesicatoria]MCC8703889.1 hypothetical protein [Xanthomonas vesicatoria]MDG4491222.1 hypothetical protein [Xanthomonas vesicatoria]
MIDLALLALLIAQEPSLSWMAICGGGSGDESAAAPPAPPAPPVRAQSAAQLKRKMQRRPGMKSADLSAGFLGRLR